MSSLSIIKIKNEIKKIHNNYSQVEIYERIYVRTYVISELYLHM